MVAILGFELPILVFIAVPVLTSFLLIGLEKILGISNQKKIISHLIAVVSSMLDLFLAIIFAVELLKASSPHPRISEEILLSLRADLTSLFFIHQKGKR